MEIVFLIGAAEYPLEETDARWLEDAIRTTCVDVSGRSWDGEARAALQIADVIADDLDHGHSPEPIELDWASAYGLLVHSFHDKAVPEARAQVLQVRASLPSISRSDDSCGTLHRREQRPKPLFPPCSSTAAGSRQ